MGTDIKAKLDMCWMCGRTKKELDSNGIELRAGDVLYEQGRDVESGRITVAICYVCAYITKAENTFLSER